MPVVSNTVMFKLILTTIIFITAFTISTTAQPEVESQWSQTAEVIYQVRGKVYLDRGTKEGINHNWRAVIIGSSGQKLFIPLNWCGEDLSFFINPDPGIYSFERSQQITLIYQPHEKPRRGRLDMAYRRQPQLPHQPAGDYIDRELASLLTYPLLESFTLHSYAQMPAGRYIMLQARPDLLYSNGSRIRIEDICFSLAYWFYNTSLSSKYMKHLSAGGDSLKLYIIDESSLLLKTDLGPEQVKAVIGDELPLLVADSSFKLQPDNQPKFLLDDIDFSSILEYDARYDVSAGACYLANQDSDSLVLVRNRYFPDSKLYPDTISIKIIGDYLDRKLAFQLGDIDLLEINYQDRARFEDRYDLVVDTMATSAYLSANNSRAYLADGMLMTALAYLLNRSSLCRIALGNSAVAESAPDLFRDTDNISPYTFDIDKGKAIIRSLTNTPRYLSILIDPDDFMTRRTAEYIKAILEREDIYLTIYNKQNTLGQLDEYDLLLSTLNLEGDHPLVLISQMLYHDEFVKENDNRSLFVYPAYRDLSEGLLVNNSVSRDSLNSFYNTLNDIPAGIFIYRPLREIALGDRLISCGLTRQGLIDFKTLELSNEAED